MKRVLFLSKKRTSQYGVSTGLLNSSQFVVNYLRKKLKVDAKTAVCVDANDIDREVHAYKPTHVIISAIWVPPEKLRELLVKWRSVKWQIRVHSKIPFLANEGIAFEWLTKYISLDQRSEQLTISGNSPDFCDAFNSAFNMKTVYLPNIYKPDYKPNYVNIVGSKDGYIDIGCFGAIRPLKNQLIQAIAAIAFGNRVEKHIRFHINADRNEQHGEQVLKNIRSLFKYSVHKLVEHPWCCHEDFLRLVSNMDIGMQVSLTETFNIVCADFVYMGIPLVVSNQIDWMPPSDTVDPHNLNEMVEALTKVYCEPNFLRKRNNLRRLNRYNNKAGELWLDYLNA